jgi:uncharacterized protein YjiS (DUF1127 family)
MTSYVHRLAPAIGWAMDWIEAPLFRAGSVFVRRMGAALQAVQCAQMVSVLNQLPDTYLSEAGLRRDDIPEYARRAIYGDAAAGSRAQG